METRLCAACGDVDTPITRVITVYNRDKLWFHNARCRGLGVANKRIADGTWVRPEKPWTGDWFICEGVSLDGTPCGKKFYRQLAYIKQNRRYHDVNCWNRTQQARRPVKNCEYCGREMKLRPCESKQRFHAECHANGKIKNPTGRWHNGRPVLLDAQGYFHIYEPTHLYANKHNGRVLEHRWIVEQSIGRYLTTTEQVDHINQDRGDNRLENLKVMNPTDHTRKTAADRVRKERAALAEIVRLNEELAKQKSVYEAKYGPLE